MTGNKEWIKKIFHPVHAGSLAAFRILFGLVMLWEVYRYFDRGWIERYWVKPVFNFKYEWFEWVQPLSPEGMILLFYFLGLLSIFITVGLFYRISASLFFLIFTYTFLLDQARYLNHFYLVILISFLMAILPANRIFSVDAWLFPKVRKKWVPYWSVLLLQFQIGIAYFFGGVAKLNMDWLTGSPMDAWLPRRSDFPFIGNYFEMPEVVWFVSYSGLLLDLLALPLLLYRKTRPWIALALVFFHFTNDRLFTIGIFPWFMIAALTIFLPASWPKDIYRYLSSKSLNQKLFIFAAGLAGAFTGAWFHEGYSTLPFLVAFLITIILIWDFHINPSVDKVSISLTGTQKASCRILAGLTAWVLFQVLVPMRHVVIPGNPSWTEEGHRFAWHMKLRSKSCNEQFYVEHRDTGERVEINGMPFLESWQRSKVSARPQLVIQYASFLSEINHGLPVYADIECSLNGAPHRQLIDPDADLTQVRFRDWKKNDWILR
jgi:vitamin K-dependent gamma-carboxylase